MIVTPKLSDIRTITQDDPGFYISDGMTVASRAGFEISPGCPEAEAQTIRKAFASGWIKMIARTRDQELVWEALSR